MRKAKEVRSWNYYDVISVIMGNSWMISEVTELNIRQYMDTHKPTAKGILRIADYIKKSGWEMGTNHEPIKDSTERIMHQLFHKAVYTKFVIEE